MGKILVVDDEDDVRLSLQRRMAREGHTVQSAASQAEAIETISKAEVPFDVVLTDMLMESPNSGVEVLKATLARDVFTEVVVLTAYGNVANAVECMKMGAFDYVEKNIPGVDVFELICIKVDQALDRRRSSLSTVRKLEQFARFQDSRGEGNEL
ncbi:MAG TPA: response regulator [Abditibacteriaceae bacterium]|jgi:DNA-binding NtrC family response regulator|nr:response regulator [Abditibacteriaceae bacterium]